MAYNDMNNNIPKGGRIVFAIFMILVYLAVGLLFIFDVFSLGLHPAVNYSVGGVLCAYGLWRGYRLYKGMN